MKQISLFIPLPTDTTKLSALLVRVDAVFGANKASYEILLTGSSLEGDVLTAFHDLEHHFPVRFIATAQNTTVGSLVHHAHYERTVFVSDWMQFPPELLPALQRVFERDRLRILIGTRGSSWHAKLATYVKNSITSFASSFTPSQVREAGIALFRTSEVEKRDIASLTAFGSEMFSQIAACRGKIAIHDIRAVRTIDPNVERGGRRNYVEFGTDEIAEKGSGFYYKGIEYVTHNMLKRETTAVERTTTSQRLLILLAFIILGSMAYLWGAIFLVGLITAVTALYFMDLLFNMFLIYRSFRSYSELRIEQNQTEIVREWPVYTIFCPLYNEVAVVPQFISAMEAIEYPKDKLEVLLLLEEDDSQTVEAIKAMKLPSYFKIVVVPDGLPKTKPKACNYGLQQATGEYAVIYDAEDIPDPLQLKKAVLAFEHEGRDTGCIQAKLNYYNWDQNLLTRLFTLEYSLLFNHVLTGLQSIRAPIPLGGTSNHFRTLTLRHLGGWDPFNVTEDADLGIRLAKRGYKTAVLDSTTLEEANSEFLNWMRQRSRWIKGYMQTYLVHMRDLREFRTTGSRLHAVTFQLVIGAKLLSMMINPFLWIMTVSYFAFREEVGPFIESLYLTPIFYMGAFCLIVGNFLYVYYYMIGAVRQKRPELILFTVFVPFYWLMMSVASYFALRDLIIRPFHWHKTKHGLHLKPEQEEVVV